MAKPNTQRTGAPIVPQVPWGQQAEQVVEEPVAATPEFIESPPDEQADNLPDAFAARDEFERKAGDASPFVAPPTPDRKFNPFTDKPPVEKADEAQPFSLEGAPSWGDFVKFIMKYGNVIAQARYPQPRGECVDTIWKGVRVVAHEKCQILHLQYGWVNWADAIAE